MASDHLDYRIGSQKPRSHLFDIELRIPVSTASTANDAPEEIRLSLPAWIPGSYMIRDFARHLVSIHAEDATGAIRPEKIDKQTWLLPNTRGNVRVRYQIYAGELSVRAAHLDHIHGYFNGVCVFLQVRGREHWPCGVEIERPADCCASRWRLATSLTPAEAPAWGFGRFQARDYADLIDHPVEMGEFSLIEFPVGGIPHAMAISGRHRCDHKRLATDLQRICENHAALFGELPIDRYLFLTQVVADGYGGLEHGASCSLLCNRDDLPQPDEAEQTDGYRRFLGLCSHEYLHLWNVKRIRPRAFIDGGLDTEVYTRLLWWFEGVTSYYDDLALIRAGLISPPDYLNLLARTISQVLASPGRLRQTVAESSFDAWTRFYKQDANAPNAIISYYSKGAMIALALDLIIRQRRHGEYSLDDLMRALWMRYGRSGIGVPEREPESLAGEITGLDLREFFAQALDDTDDLDLTPLFESVGIRMEQRPATNLSDSGGAPGQPQVANPKPSIGVRLSKDCQEARLAAVLNDRPAEIAGLAPADIIVALDGLRVTAANFDRLLARCPIGQPIRVHAFRGDELHEFSVVPQSPPADLCQLSLIEDAPAEALAARTAWLGPQPNACA